MTFEREISNAPCIAGGSCQELFGNYSSVNLRGERRSLLAWEEVLVASHH